jgi:hypothetical protein
MRVLSDVIEPHSPKLGANIRRSGGCSWSEWKGVAFSFTTGRAFESHLMMLPVKGIQSLAIERFSDLAEPLCAQLAPVRELVVSIPAPRCDHGKHEDPALAEQLMVNIRIALADLFGPMGQVELDRPTATRLEVNEERADFRAEQVAWVRFAVQQLLGGAAVDDRSPQAS